MVVKTARLERRVQQPGRCPLRARGGKHLRTNVAARPHSHKRVTCKQQRGNAESVQGAMYAPARPAC